MSNMGHKSMTGGEVKLTLSVFAAFFAIHCVEFVYFVYGNVLESYGYSPQATGVALGIFFIAIMASRPIGGWMIENLGIRRSMILGGILALLGCSMLMFTRNLYVILAGRAMSGLAFGAFTMGIFSYQTLVTTPENRGRFIALTSTGGVLPTATVTPLGELLVLGGHIKPYLAIGPLFSILCLFLGISAPKVKTTHGSEVRKWGTYRDLIRNRPFVMLVATSTMMAIVDASITSISLFSAEYGIPASYFLISFSTTAVMSRTLGARIINSLPRPFCLAPSGMLMASALAVASALPSRASFIICGSLFGIGIGVGFPVLLASLADILPPELRPKGTAAALFLFDAGWSATPILVGFMTPYLGRGLSFITLAIITLAVLFSLTIFYWLPRMVSERRAAGS